MSEIKERIENNTAEMPSYSSDASAGTQGAFEDELTRLNSLKENFSGQVKDAFGQSIVSEVFEPSISQVNALITLNENLQNTLSILDSRVDEIVGIRN